MFYKLVNNSSCVSFNSNIILEILDFWVMEIYKNVLKVNNIIIIYIFDGLYYKTFVIVIYTKNTLNHFLLITTYK